MSLFYIPGYIIRKDVESSNDLLFNDTIFFLPPKVRRFCLRPWIKHIFRQQCTISIFMSYAGGRDAICLCFGLKFVFSLCQKYRSNIFLKNHFLYTPPIVVWQRASLGSIRFTYNMILTFVRNVHISYIYTYIFLSWNILLEPFLY